jgi:hypothetical protein
MAQVYTIAAFPKDLILRDGTGFTVRSLEPSDEERLLAFFLGLPASLLSTVAVLE